MLAKSAGNWNVTMASRMAPGAVPFNGFGLIGCDNGSQKYVGNRCDNMGTGIMRCEGSCDERKKVLTCKGNYIDPATGETVTATMISRTVDDDRHVSEMWSPGPDGQPMKWMEMDNRRAK